ncbi:MAG: 2-oxoacid:acceptor oxidoreductase subunit alpha [Pseudodesulfovibrio sp.]|uniref:Pyruvate flavodoxin/ferredoxin oxidoreductase domain protein n=1 Tax=Pseudodesulfovibrio aespoeensis (strain ATCC 700646 / DSM 10631 / Aspo-2) TaxID=643562 RepID=E6VW16_PSEA9|nr:MULTISPECIES: 2-oxoacid:acceptor oxidoreductase subunit alpha [Pseudodesulfovibrio]MBU4379610.1 2-oxoacid:acceptor oxidoreductase subunit alpha [Pseudomonadota bacterium]ADU62461.1 pyruvate flavodoxin/ferredoxin oxidoreductase domain protein [Pseudodesulfovibrio aespoeensis Aspo-2]MBU4476698.1 2-oxoacid:acceptor oxidoreductase subunit alpha [Pseudomonadota bacterium]MBU4515072.1 2-oxoacid:acceptor oxidoreductase subunit alpha [Pseudomonadota bacterium]MBU4520977.1 2-oxoacid:acceptor oxidore
MPDTGINIVIGGEAGQGLATLGQIMARAVMRAGYHLLVKQDYMSRIRGGHNFFSIRMGAEPVLAVTEAIDILVAMDARTIELHRDRLNPGAVVIAGDSIDTAGLNALRVPLKDLAPKPLFYNVVALGVLGGAVCADVAILEDLLRQTFGKKGDAVVQANIEVVRKAHAWVGEQKYDFSCIAPLPKNAEKRLMLNGNEAIAMGALAAGCNFVSFYPMTPATTVPTALIAKGRSLGLVHDQAEDEIAAINMAIGASYAGAKALVATSGGGFALMVEGVSLAGVSETPLVVVVAQRPGPATGLATRTEQADLNLVLHAGHGEFPRAIFAPGTVEECYYLTHHAFDLAEQYQTPMFVLTDQFLADSYRDVPPFDLDDLPQIAQPLMEAPVPYSRYAVTDDGVSPRVVPGFAEVLVRADSHEHDEQSHMTEDAANRVRQNVKRLDKGNGLMQDVIGPDYYGPDENDEDADLVLLCWGSSLGACLEAAETLNKKAARRVAVLHFSQVYPLREEQFMDRLEAAGQVVAVEGNATAQFARLVARETGFTVTGSVLRFDGRPLSPEYVLKGLESII